MHRTLVLILALWWISPVSAESDTVLTKRFLNVLREELDRQDCLWREALASGPPAGSTPDLLRDTASEIAAKCSQDIRRSIIEGPGTTSDDNRKELAVWDLIGARDRTLAIFKYLQGNGGSPPGAASKP